MFLHFPFGGIFRLKEVRVRGACINSDVSLFSGSILVFKGCKCHPEIFHSHFAPENRPGPKTSSDRLPSIIFQRQTVSFGDKWDPYFGWIKLDAQMLLVIFEGFP